MARTIFVLIALVAMSAPVTAIDLLEVELPPLPNPEELEMTGAGSGELGETGAPDVDEPSLGSSDPSTEAEDMSDCSLVIAYRLAAWGGLAGETRTGMENIRVVEPVSTAVPAGIDVPALEGAVVKAIGQGLPIQLGQAASGLAVVNDVPIAVRAEWTETYVSWHLVQNTFFVDLGTGLPLLLGNNAWTHLNCDPDADVYDRVPSLDMTAYQYSSPVEMEDGWITEIVNLDVRIAGLLDSEVVMDEDASSITNEEVLWAIWRAIDLLDLETLLALLPIDIVNILLTQVEAGDSSSGPSFSDDGSRRGRLAPDFAPGGSDGGDAGEDDLGYNLASAMPTGVANSSLWLLLAILAALVCVTIAYAANRRPKDKK